MKTVCFTGHRPNKLNGYEIMDNKQWIMKLREIIIDHIENKGTETFITGMALGVDMWSALIVNQLKKTYPQVKLVCAIPCKDQAKVWQNKSPESVALWNKIVNEMADEVVYVSNEPYTPWCMQKRNEWMVDNSNAVIAVWDGTTGGTFNCIRYARKYGRQMTYLHPKTLEITTSEA